MAILEVVAEYIGNHALLPPGSKVLAAVSGGPDSLTLLGVLVDLGYTVTVAHFNHQLRASSGQDAEQVRRIANSFGLTCIVGSGDVRLFARQHRTTIEESARILRYGFLAQEAMARGIACVATGHTADDQAETVMMHLIRGAGPDGLRGMLPSIDLGSWLPQLAAAQVRLIRPLLCMRRTQTENYCNSHNLEPILDSSNADPAFWRNRIRTEMIPKLETYNPRAVEGIGRLADIMQAQADCLDTLADSIWADIARVSSPEAVVLGREQFLRQPRGMQQLLIRRAIRLLRPALRDLAYRHVETALAFFRCPTASRSTDLALGVRLIMEEDGVRLAIGEKLPEEPAWQGQSVPMSGSIQLETPAWRMTTLCENTPIAKNFREDKNPFIACMDIKAIQPPLVLRRRTPGDRFDPLGMRQTVKLSDFLAAQHLPRERRDGWPLVCDGLGVLWVPGYRIAERAKVTDDTAGWISIKVARLDIPDDGN